MPSRSQQLFAVIFCLALAFPAAAEVLGVGPGKLYATPCAAVAAAADGDIIEIDAAGNYAGDVCVIRPNNLKLRGVGGRAKIDAAGQNAQGKAIWVINGNHTIVENIEFDNAKVPDNNGAGIRVNQAGLTLTVRNCVFRNNEMGILTGNSGGELLVEYSEFVGSGNSRGLAHNIYVGHIDKFIFQYNYSHDSVVGHTVKSRAAENYILYNWISTAESTGSYEIDLPNGGRSYVVGNVIVQGPRSENPSILSYLAEGRDPKNPSVELHVINNTFVNKGSQNAKFVRVVGDPSPPPVVLNNLFVGGGTPVSPATGRIEGNLATLSPGFVDIGAGDYHLRGDSPAVDQGVEVSGDVVPAYHYVLSECGEGRAMLEGPDIGAFEFGGRMAPNADAPPRCWEAFAAPGMVVANAASGATRTFAAGSIISLYGEGLADAEAMAGEIPLPRELAGVSVVSGGVRLPLFYAGPRQINAQLPPEAPGGVARLTCLRHNLEQQVAFLEVAATAPGIFLYPGTDRAVALHQNYRLNSAENPAAPGSVVLLYLTGQGPTENPVPAGEAARADPLSPITLPAGASVGGQPAVVQFLGLAPGMVGVAQANIYVPALAPGPHAVVITVGGAASNAATIFVGE